MDRVMPGRFVTDAESLGKTILIGWIKRTLGGGVKAYAALWVNQATGGLAVDNARDYARKELTDSLAWEIFLCEEPKTNEALGEVKARVRAEMWEIARGAGVKG